MPAAGLSMLLLRGLVLAAAGGVAAANGLVSSPLFDFAEYMMGVAMRGYPLVTRGILYNYITPFAIAAMTLLIAGIPAALYERIRGLQTSTPVSLAIWLAATLLLALPTIMRALGEE
jgi:hypothetical protein